MSKMKIAEIELKNIKEAPFNYNLHPDNQITELKRSLNEFGQFKNIVVWKNQCIAGNGLMFAAKDLGWESLNAVVMDDLSEAQAKKLCVTDNASPYLAKPDTEKLEDILKGFPTIKDIPGLTEDWLMNIGEIDISITDREPPEEFPEYDENIETEYCCPKCNYEWSGKPK